MTTGGQSRPTNQPRPAKARAKRGPTRTGGHKEDPSAVQRRTALAEFLDTERERMSEFIKGRTDREIEWRQNLITLYTAEIEDLKGRKATLAQLDSELRKAKLTLQDTVSIPVTSASGPTPEEPDGKV